MIALGDFDVTFQVEREAQPGGGETQCMALQDAEGDSADSWEECIGRCLI